MPGSKLLPVAAQLQTSSGSAVVPWVPLWCVSDGRCVFRVSFRMSVLLAATVAPFIFRPVSCTLPPGQRAGTFPRCGHFTLLPPITTTVLHGFPKPDKRAPGLTSDLLKKQPLRLLTLVGRTPRPTTLQKIWLDLRDAPGFGCLINFFTKHWKEIRPVAEAYL